MRIVHILLIYIYSAMYNDSNNEQRQSKSADNAYDVHGKYLLTRWARSQERRINSDNSIGGA